MRNVPRNRLRARRRSKRARICEVEIVDVVGHTGGIHEHARCRRVNMGGKGRHEWVIRRCRRPRVQNPEHRDLPRFAATVHEMLLRGLRDSVHRVLARHVVVEL